MARKNTEELIHCNVCGEDYSTTYRRCPFCGERADARPAPTDEEDDDGYVFDGQALFDDPSADPAAPGKGGKRLAAGGSGAPKNNAAKNNGGRGTSAKPSPIKSSSGKGGRFDATGPINWSRMITYGISLVIIVVALIIIFTVVYPMVYDPGTGSTTPPATGSSNVTPTGGPTGTGDPTGDPTGTPTGTGTTTPPPTTNPGELAPGSVGYIVGAPSGLRVRSGPGTTYDILASLVNGNEVTILEDAGEGWYKIAYAGAGGQAAVGYIMGEYIDVSGGQTTTPPTTQPTNDPGSTTAGLAPGSTGKITGAASGLNVRSGPGTSYDRIGSLANGDEVTILESAGNGWYQISYQSSGGTAIGYVLGDYITAK